MKPSMLLAALLLISTSTSVRADAVINVGDYSFSPGEIRTIPLYVTSDQEVTGLSLYMQIGDGGADNGGFDTTPMFSAVDIVGPGTIFSASNMGQSDTQLPLMWVAETLTNPPEFPSTLSCNGIFAYVTIDAGGALPGQSYAFNLTGVAANIFGESGLDTCFVDALSNEIYPTITNGTISIVPEPGSAALLCGLLAGLSLLTLRRRTAR
jgi:hypothetical protein